MAPAAAGERSLKETPTWAVAIACAVFIVISIIIEQAIHALGKVCTYVYTSRAVYARNISYY